MKVFLASLLLLSSTPTLASEPHPYLQQNLKTLRDREEQQHRPWKRYGPSRTVSDSQAGYSSERKCFREEYMEEYVPGTSDNPGHVRSFNKTVQIPCDSRSGYTSRTTIEYDTNDCSEGTAAGAILGGGLGAVLSRGDGRWWAIPTGIVGGAMLGCQIDGG